MEYLSLLFRWLHIVPALIMFGGAFFVRFCLIDSQSNEASLLDRQDGVRRRWMKWVMIATLALLVSGLYNAGMKEMAYKADMLYRGLLMVKILLALVVFYLAAVMAGRSQRAIALRQREAHWLNVLLVLMLLIVMIGGYMRLHSQDWPKKIRELGSVGVQSFNSNSIS